MDLTVKVQIRLYSSSRPFLSSSDGLTVSLIQALSDEFPFLNRLAEPWLELFEAFMTPNRSMPGLEAWNLAYSPRETCIDIENHDDAYQ